MANRSVGTVVSSRDLPTGHMAVAAVTEADDMEIPTDFIAPAPVAEHWRRSAQRTCGHVVLVGLAFSRTIASSNALGRSPAFPAACAPFWNEMFDGSTNSTVRIQPYEGCDSVKYRAGSCIVRPLEAFGLTRIGVILSRTPKHRTGIAS